MIEISQLERSNTFNDWFETINQVIINTNQFSTADDAGTFVLRDEFGNFSANTVNLSSLTLGDTVQHITSDFSTHGEDILFTSQGVVDMLQSSNFNLFVESVTTNTLSVGNFDVQEIANDFSQIDDVTLVTSNAIVNTLTSGERVIKPLSLELGDNAVNEIALNMTAPTHEKLLTTLTFQNVLDGVDLKNVRFNSLRIGSGETITTIKNDFSTISSSVVPTTSAVVNFLNAGVTINAHSLSFESNPTLEINEVRTNFSVVNNQTIPTTEAVYTLVAQNGGSGVVPQSVSAQNEFLQWDGTDYLNTTIDGSSHIHSDLANLTGASDVDFQTLNLNVADKLTVVGETELQADVLVTGELNVTGDITANFSDMRLKTKVSNLENVLGKIENIQTFTYTPNEIATERFYAQHKTSMGVSAQEIQEVFPELVRPTFIDSEYLTVDYMRMNVVLLKAIQELKAELDEIKSKI